MIRWVILALILAAAWRAFFCDLAVPEVRKLRGAAHVLAAVMGAEKRAAVHLVRGYRMDGTVNWICECKSWCMIDVEIPVEIAQRVTERGWYPISDLCAHGAGRG